MNANPLPITLTRWSEAHAGLMLAVMGMAMLHLPLWTSAALAAVSFGVLIILSRGNWTPSGRFGGANLVTLLRLLATLALLGAPSVEPLAVFATALAILVFDGIDGWIARKSGSSSEFGEYFDKEVDAFFMLALCLLLDRDEQVGSWILLAGGLRYLFVLFLKIAQPPRYKETATRFSKAVGAGMLSVLIACFWPLAAYCSILAGVAGFALIVSFALSIQAMYSHR